MQLPVTSAGAIFANAPDTQATACIANRGRTYIILVGLKVTVSHNYSTNGQYHRIDVQFQGHIAPTMPDSRLVNIGPEGVMMKFTKGHISHACRLFVVLEFLYRQCEPR